MRSIQILGWACITALSGSAAAQNVAEPEPIRMATRSALVPDISAVWQSRPTAPGTDRLRYLNGSRCADRPGCADPIVVARDPDAPVEYEYIDSLDLGTYGPVRFKFTGDRVKLQVKF